MLQLGDPAPDAIVYSRGEPVRTPTLWADRPVVLSFQRHFGCPCTKEQLGTLTLEHPRIADAGAYVVAVLMGSAAGAESFCSDRDLPFTCLADPDRSAYRAFHIPTAGPAKWLLSPRSIAYLATSYRRGIGMAWTPKDQSVTQMPGTFVIARGGGIRLAHYNRDMADVFSIDDILGALGS